MKIYMISKIVLVSEIYPIHSQNKFSQKRLICKEYGSWANKRLAQKKCDRLNNNLDDGFMSLIPTLYVVEEINVRKVREIKHQKKFEKKFVIDDLKHCVSRVRW